MEPMLNVFQMLGVIGIVMLVLVILAGILEM